MVEEAQDYVREESTEEVVLTRWDRTKKYVEMCMATKKLYMFVMALLCGTTGTLAVGEITETNPLRDAAIEVGLVDPVDIQAEEEMVELMIAETNTTEVVVVEPGSDHTHPHGHQTMEEDLLILMLALETENDRPPVAHTHEAHKHETHPHTPHTHPAGGVSAEDAKRFIAEALLDSIPPDHRKLH